MNVNFLFMDESCSEALDSKNTVISSLTGLLVPLQKYPEIRTQFYNLFEWSINPESNVRNLAVPELHGKELLPDESDKRKIEMLEGVVELVVSNRLEIFRGGYYITNTLREVFKGDEEMLGTVWLGILNLLGPRIKNEMIVPVMDGFNSKTVRIFSQMVKTMDVMRATGHEKHMTVRNSENILGEVFYGDSKYSIFTQVIDLVSWLRHLSDMSREGKQLTPYKSQLLKISEKLAPAIVYEEIIAMNFNGVVQKPFGSRDQNC
jgi:hypothetical protein